MKGSSNNFNNSKKLSSRQGIQIGFLSIILFAVITLTVWNASALQAVLNKSTQDYAKDVTYQLACDISARLEKNKTDLIMVADSLSKINIFDDNDALTEYLDRKAEILEFDKFIYINGVEGLGDAESDYLKDITGIKASFHGENSVFYVEGQTILYSVPVYSGDNISGVLAGVRKKENMQTLIQPKSFDGQGLTCIINTQGEVIISPTELKPFLQLDNIIQSDTDDAEEIRKMKTNMEKHIDGVFQFTSVDETELIISYQGLGMNDWVLLTMIPADLISSGADNYIFRTFIIIGGITVVFALFLAAVYRFYNSHRKHLEVIAFKDMLTGGMNNAAFQLVYQRLSPGMARNQYAVVMLNVKGFKLVNETYGIICGNEILKFIYQVVTRHLNEGEFASRSEVDHYFLCLKENDPKAIQNRLDYMISEIQTFNGINPSYNLTILQGAYIVDDPNMEVTLVQDRARTACQSRRSINQLECVFYDADITKRLQKELELEGMFERSLENHEFQLYLQPKIHLRSGKIAGAEALVRWKHPSKGVIYPSDFIPVFERSLKICQLDLYMFEEVCRLMENWAWRGVERIPVSVNLSRQHFKRPDFLKDFYEIAQKYHIPPKAIEFELTESIFFDNQQIEIVKNSVKKMHEMGFLCSLDDFGAGFSSLGLLKEFEVDTIKLDRRFFLDISDKKARDIIGSLIMLSKKLKVQVVAEGIETDEQLEYLRSVDCDMIQGYIFSKPLAVEEFESWTGHH